MPPTNGRPLSRLARSVSRSLVRARRSLWEHWDRIPQFYRYIIFIGLSLTISISGVVWATLTHRCAEAGRGGALATILAVATMFLRPDYGMLTYDDGKAERSRIANADERLQTEIEDVVQWLRINSSGQSHLNAAIFLASLVGSLFWGFGDLLPKYLPWLGTCSVCHC